MNTNFLPRRLAHWACACTLVTGVAHADAPPAEPADPAPGLPLYQRWVDIPVTDWRAANARVHEVGGWRTYLRESQGDAAGDDAHAHHHHHH